jgi:ligand-binding sensor domain-containing protein/signal transduction histidine kinase
MRKYISIFIMIGSLIGGSFSISTAQTKTRFARNISQQYGLPTQTVYDLHIDNLGYLYLGTDLGLYRFNGTVFQKIPIEGNIDAAVDNIVTMDDNTLWCKNFANQIFILENDTLREYEALKELVKGKGVLEAFVAHEQSLYIANHQAVHHYDRAAKSISKLHSVTAGETDAYTRAILYDTVKNQLRFQDRAILMNNGQLALEPSEVSAYTKFEGRLLATKRNINPLIYDIDRKQTIGIEGLPERTTIYFPRKTKDKLWLCTNQGAFEIDLDEGQIISQILPGYRISDILEDAEGNYWISSLDEGVFFFPSIAVFNTGLDNTRFDGRRAFLSAHHTTKNTVLIGTSDGYIIELNEDGSFVREFYTGLSFEIEFIHKDEELNLILCTNGVFNYDHPEIRRTFFLGKDILEDGKGNYLFAHSVLTGIMNKDLKTKPARSFPNSLEFKVFKDLGNPILQVSDVRGKTVYYSEQNDLYFLASVDDLYIISQSKGTQKPRVNETTPLVVNAITETPNGRLWLASAQDGLIELIQDNQQNFTPYSRSLEGSTISKMAKNGNVLYLLSAGDLYEYQTEQALLKRLPVSDVFSGLKINDILIADDHMWVISNVGVHTFALSEEWTSLPPALIFKGGRVNGQQETNIQRLRHTENNLGFDFDLIQLGSNGNSLLEFRLLGNEKDWQAISGSTRSLALPSLAPGKYNLEVRGFAKGLYSNVLQFPFEIQAAWWSRWQVLSGIFALTALGLYFVFYRKEKRRKKEEFIKVELAKSQIKSLRSQMNPHFMFNILNAVQGFIYTGRKSDAAEYLSNFSTLMRKTLDLSNEQSISLKEELEVLNLYVDLEIPRFDEKILYQQEIEENIDLEAIQVPSLFIQPFVENAFKHGLKHKEGEKKLSLRIRLIKDNLLEIEIEDNGIGIEASKIINQKRREHKSFATNAIFSRLELINQTLKEPISLEIQDLQKEREESGTRVRILVPISDD